MRSATSGPLHVKPNPFRYLKPQSLEEALKCLDEHGSECAPLAGSESLVSLTNFPARQARVARKNAGMKC